KYKEGLEVARTVEAKAPALGYLPLQAEALLALGDLQDAFGDHKASEESLKHALRVAEASHHDEVKLQAATGLVGVFSGDASRIEEAHEWFEYGMSILSRMKKNDAASARLHSQQAAAFYTEGKYADAEANHRKALAFAETSLGPDSFEACTAKMGLGSVFSIQ